MRIIYKNNKKIYGFTLSEVLITLVIIGVISAITIPVLSALWQKEALKSAFTKTYSELNNFSRKFYSDYGYSFSEYCQENYSSCINMMMSYYYNKSGIASNDLYTTEREDSDSTYSLRLLSGQKLGTGAYSGTTICDNSSQIADLSGKLYRLNDRPKTDTNGPIICVDTNGLKGPNRYGYDYFLFIFTIDGRTIPMGMEDENNSTDTDITNNGFVTGSSYCSRTGTNTKSNAACAYYALSDIHPNNSNKTYWKDFI